MASKPDISIRGIRQSLPAGYLLGRITHGYGPAELVSYSDLAGKLVSTGSVTGPANPAPQQWVAGAVSALSTGLSIVGTTLTNAWQLGKVTALSGISIVGTTLTVAAQQWTAGAVSALSSGLSIVGTTLTAAWQAGTVTSIGSGLNLSGGGLTGNWQATTVTSIGSGLTNTAGVLTASGSGGSAPNGMLPLVNGDLPGPSPIADTNGQFIGVAL